MLFDNEHKPENMGNTMSKYDKKYDAFKIFEEIQASGQDEIHMFQSENMVSSTDQKKEMASDLPDGDMYYEIEYDSCPIPGVGKFVLKSQKIEAPIKDEIRDTFHQMRDIAREKRSFALHNSKFYDKRVQRENAQIFYEQAMFMKDFEDKYAKAVPYSAYFPCYQMMGYEQLRTYFTWRTEVRNGIVEETSLSYAFLYIYELLGNVGVANPQEGLDRLMFFWKEFRVYNQTIDKYMLKWLKDYHIYYELPQSFKEFTEEYDLGMHYPHITDAEDNFALLCSISKYDIRKSVFYTEDKVKLIQECLYFTLDRVKNIFEEKSICFDEAIFQPVKNMITWNPFKDALFYPWMEQRDRRVVFSEKEVYVCSGNKWTFNTALTTESGRKLLGYIVKQMEVTLRKITKYKYKMTANIATVDQVLLARLRYVGISLEKVITDAVVECYREATKTVVKVDDAALVKIRQEALITQEKLIVPEQEEQSLFVPVSKKDSQAVQQELSLPQPEEPSVMPIKQQGEETASLLDAWGELKNALSELEIKVLLMALNGEADIKGFADKNGVMLEVLLDGINEKAMDFVGDSLLDDEFAIYDDYIEQVKGMVE